MEKIELSEGVYTVKMDDLNEAINCEESFYGVHSMEEFHVPEGATTIANKGFAYCFKLKRIYVPASITNLGESTFYGVSGPIELHYAGTGEQFEALGAPKRVKKMIRISGKYDVQPYCIDEGNFYEEQESWEAFDHFCRDIDVICSDGVKLHYGYHKEK